MRIVFAGTPEFAATALRAILAAPTAQGFEVALVLTQPDRPAGRGMRLSASPVKALALEHGLPVAMPSTLNRARDAAAADAALDALRAARPDVLVVAAYGLIVPQAVLDVPGGLGDGGCGQVTALNIHASLLPRWRGAAPAARAIEAGDSTTGITIMQMNAGLDTGPMLFSQALAIEPSDTTGTLTARLADLGARMIVAALAAATRAQLRASPQPSEGATYARKLDKTEAWLDWRASAPVLAQRVRAFDPFPIAAARLGVMEMKVWRAHAASGSGAEPGTIVAADRGGVRIACAVGDLLVTELQRAGGKRLSAADFLAGTPIQVGARLAVPGAD
ncbi:MAG TPA: methionyl-tRNA formyltransferase [Burkholderiaceae bacterium]|nr:methionyl-tRNA formyltransferase [Burkholderiaceae bacterium]